MIGKRNKLLQKHEVEVLDLIDLKEKIAYSWETIYVGVIQNYFEPKIISDYAVELGELASDFSDINNE